MHGGSGIRRSVCLLLFLILLPGCQPAERYRGVESTEAKREPVVPKDYGWMTRPAPPFDTPIDFVHAGSRPDEWRKLASFWNPLPEAAGPRTSHLGLNPLEAAVAFVAALQFDTVRIKVPLGLPDPGPYLPASNPPTLAKWRLGKTLFFADDWLSGSEFVSCAGCHKPAEGFTRHRTSIADDQFDTLSLINTVYQRYWFWDGRATALEQTVIMKLEDERTRPAPESGQHSWPGVIERLRRNKRYTAEFQAVFGVPPTQDHLAKALATYMRTILSGDSLYDQATAKQQESGAKQLDASHFRAVLTSEALRELKTDLSLDEAARALHQGYTLFHSKARCSQCHTGPLFTDHDFHNLGIRFADRYQLEDLIATGGERGHFVHAPIGLKNPLHIGAYRTPTLRSLPRTEPYFNDGHRQDLARVLTFYNEGIDGNNRRLDPKLLETPGTPVRLGLDAPQLRALELFLRSLNGQDVPAVIAGVEKKK
jgi:cytochrome c peroxidase